MKRIISIVLIVVAASSVGLSVPSRAEASVTLTKIERAVLDYVNLRRARHGLARVHAQADLMKAARAHSRDMAHRCYFAHASAAGESYVERVIEFGYGMSGWSRWTVGEDIYSGRAGTSLATARAAIIRWMSSPAHRAVLLRGIYRDAGIGVHEGGGMRYFTLDLGRRVP